MPQDLNLLPSSAKFQANRIKLLKLSKKYMVTLGLVWVGIVVVVAVVWLGAQGMLKSAEAKYSESVNQYKQMAAEVVTSQVLKYRAKVVSGVLATRFEYGQTLSRLNSLFPAEVILDNFTVERSKSIILSGKISGNNGADIVEQKVNEINAKELVGFSSAKLTSLSFKNGTWQFTMEVVVDEKAK